MNIRVQSSPNRPTVQRSDRPTDLGMPIPAFSPQPSASSLSSRSLSTRAFTAAEMLTVIVIISIVISLIVPSARLVQRYMERNRARTDANALVQAVTHYQQVYGDWPLTTVAAQTGLLIAGTNTVIANAFDPPLQLTVPLATVLTQLSPALNNPANPRQILFLSMPTNSLRNGDLIDPWGNSYVLIMGAQQCSFFSNFPDFAFSNLPAFAISSGPPTVNQANPSNWVFSAGVRP